MIRDHKTVTLRTDFKIVVVDIFLKIFPNFLTPN